MTDRAYGTPPPSAVAAANFYEHADNSKSSARQSLNVAAAAAAAARYQDFQYANPYKDARFYANGAATNYPHYAYTTYPYGYPSHFYSHHQHTPPTAAAVPPSSHYPHHHHHHHHHPYRHHQHHAAAYAGQQPYYAGLLGTREQYFSHPQTPSHHGMFTPAGQQLVPSSVLHYPARRSAYPTQLLQQESQQRQYANSMYDSMRHESSSSYYLQQQQAAHASLLHMQQTAYNPYAISQHHFQQSQAQPSLPNYAEARSNQKLHTPTFTSSSAAATSSELPTDIRDTHRSGDTELQPAAGNCNSSEDSPAADTQRLTTSPPLISDSGISSCSTRVRSDSSQSTPVYSGEYPMSVGSSSGVSYHDDLLKRQCEDDTVVAANAEEADNNASLMQLEQQPEQQQEIKNIETNTNETAAPVVETTQTLKAIESRTPSPPARNELQQAPTPYAATEEQQQNQKHYKQHNQAQHAQYWSAKSSDDCGYSHNVFEKPSHPREHNAPVESPNNKSKSNARTSLKSQNLDYNLLPSKKSKRKSFAASAVEAEVKTQELKPLPGFQQAFGSTEIGRFSETFLLSQVADSLPDTHTDNTSSRTQRVWSPYESCESWNGRGAIAGAAIAPCQYGNRASAIRRPTNNLNEIRCNGY